jgi:hypothetical protein
VDEKTFANPKVVAAVPGLPLLSGILEKSIMLDTT